MAARLSGAAKPVSGKFLPGEPVRDPSLHRLPVRGVCVSPDGRWLATASEDQTVRIWDLETGVAIGEPFVHNNSVYTVAFNSDGTRLLTAGKDGLWRVWDLVSSLYAAMPLAYRSMVWQARYTPDGKRLVCAPEAAGVFIYDAQSLQLLRRLPESEHGVHGLALDSTGRQVAFAGWNPPRIYDVKKGGEPNGQREHRPVLAVSSDFSRTEDTSFQHALETGL